MTISRRNALLAGLGGAAASVPIASPLADGRTVQPASKLMEDTRAHEATFLIEQPFLGPDVKEGEIVEGPVGTRLLCHGKEIGLVESIRYEHDLGGVDDVVRTKVEFVLFGNRVEVRRRGPDVS